MRVGFFYHSLHLVSLWSSTKRASFVPRAWFSEFSFVVVLHLIQLFAFDMIDTPIV